MILVWVLVMMAGFLIGLKLADLVIEYVSHSWAMRQDRLLLEELKKR